MKKLVLAVVVSNLVMLTAGAMTSKSRRLVYPEAASSMKSKSMAHQAGAYSPLGTTKRVTPAQAEKSRKLVYPSKASVQAEGAVAVKSLKGSK